MKINKVDKINEHFREIKTESIFAALKEKNILDLQDLKSVAY